MPLADRLAAFASRLAAEFNAVRGELAGGGATVQLERAAFDMLAGEGGLAPGTSYLITDEDALLVALSSTAYLVATTAKIYAPVNILPNGLLQEAGPPPTITEGGGTATLVFDEAAQKLRFTGGTLGSACMASWTIAGLEAGSYLLKFELSEQAIGCRPRFTLGGASTDVIGATDGEHSVALTSSGLDENLLITFTPNGAGRVAAVGKLRLYRQTAELSLSSTVVSEGAPIGTVVGAIEGAISGSTLTLTDNAGGRFALDGLNIVTAAALDYEESQQHLVKVDELSPGADESPRTSPLGIQVTNVINLMPITVDDPNIWPGTLALEWAGQLQNMTSGSAVELVDDCGGRFILDGSILRNAVDMNDANGTQYFPVVRETLAGVEDSPKDTPIQIIVTDQAT